MSKMDDFIERFQSLPPELYTEIRNLTITPDFPKTCHIDESYKPPNILQVNQQTRLELTCEFYANTIFTFPNNLADSSTKCVLKRWLNLLSMKQRQSLLSSELHILTELKIQNYFSPAQRGLGVIFHSNCMARTDQIALGTLGRNVHKAFSGYDVLWRVNMMENVRFVCLMDDGLEALVNVDFKMQVRVDGLLTQVVQFEMEDNRAVALPQLVTLQKMDCGIVVVDDSFSGPRLMIRRREC